MGAFRAGTHRGAGITDRVELTEGGEQRPAAWEEGCAWRPGIRWHGGAALEMGLGDLRRVGAELGVSSPNANRDQGLGLPHSPHSCEDQNCSLLEWGGVCVEATGGPEAPQSVGHMGGAREKHSQATQIRRNLHPRALTSGLLMGHGRRTPPPAVPSESYGSLKAGRPSYTLRLHLKDE